MSHPGVPDRSGPSLQASRSAGRAHHYPGRAHGRLRRVHDRRRRHLRVRPRPDALTPGLSGNPGARRTISTMAEWWSIEVLHGGFSAFRWQEQHDSALIEAALTNGAVDGAWHADRWGVVFEICFGNEERREKF